MVDAAAASSARPVLERDTSSKRKFSFLGHTRYRVELPEALRAPTVTKQGLIVGSLPDDYQPTPLDIVCGRGRGNYNCPGNLLFRQIVSESVDEYLAAANKQAKTDVLKRVLQQVQEQSQNKCQFIKQCPDTNKWCLLNETAAREKAGHAMREACATRKKLNTSKKACRSNTKPLTKDALLDSVNSTSTASTATTSVSSQAPSSVSSRSGLTYLGDSSRTEFANASGGDSSRSLQLQHVPPQHSVAIPPPAAVAAHEQEGGLAMPLPASMILPGTMNQPTPVGMAIGDDSADSSRNLSGSRQNSARNLLSSVGNLLGGGRNQPQHPQPNAVPPRNSLLGSASDFDIGGLSDELQSRMSLNDDNNSTTTWAKSSLTSMPPKRKSLEEPLGQHFSLDDLPNDNDDDDEKVDVLDLHPKADLGFPTVAAHAGGGQSGQVFGQAVADLPVRLHAEKEDALRKRQSMLSGGDSVLSAVGSSTFLANQRSSDFFAQFTE